MTGLDYLASYNPLSRKGATQLLSSSEFGTPSSEFLGVILRAITRELKIPLSAPSEH